MHDGWFVSLPKGASLLLAWPPSARPGILSPPDGSLPRATPAQHEDDHPRGSGRHGVSALPSIRSELLDDPYLPADDLEVDDDPPPALRCGSPGCDWQLTRPDSITARQCLVHNPSAKDRPVEPICGPCEKPLNGPSKRRAGLCGFCGTSSPLPFSEALPPQQGTPWLLVTAEKATRRQRVAQDDRMRYLRCRYSTNESRRG
jgi:hypothetical protein